MSLRNALDKHKKWFVPTFVVVVFAILGLTLLNSQKGEISTETISRAYFTDDDGKTYFEDDVSKAFPFDRGGKSVYRAYVYRCGDKGKPFVGAVGRQSKPSGQSVTLNSNYKGETQPGPIEIRKPGTENWVTLASPDGMKLIQSLCPDGRPQAVIPGEE